MTLKEAETIAWEEMRPGHPGNARVIAESEIMFPGCGATEVKPGKERLFIDALKKFFCEIVKNPDVARHAAKLVLEAIKNQQSKQ